MKVTVLQEKFSKALNIASRFTSSRAQLPVLANIYISASKNSINVSSTNLETSVSVNLGAKVEKEGEITIPSRIISELVTNIKNETIELEVEKENINIKSNGFSSKILGMNASEFPKVPGSVGKGILSFSSEDFSKTMSRVMFAVSLDETRPVLTGVLFNIRKNDIEVVATDGFRLSKTSFSTEGEGESAKVIIPKNILLEILKLSKETEKVRFSFKKSENQVIFEVGDYVFSSRIIDGEFPNYSNIIPQSSKYEISTDRQEFLQSIKLASVFARDSANVVKFVFGKKSFDVSAESQAHGEQKGKLDMKLEKGEFGKNYAIAFNFKFLEEYLNSFGGEEVLVKLNDPKSPGVFMDKSDKNYLHLVMPVKLQE